MSSEIAINFTPSTAFTPHKNIFMGHTSVVAQLPLPQRRVTAIFQNDKHNIHTQSRARAATVYKSQFFDCVAGVLYTLHSQSMLSELAHATISCESYRQQLIAMLYESLLLTATFLPGPKSGPRGWRGWGEAFHSCLPPIMIHIILEFLYGHSW